MQINTLLVSAFVHTHECKTHMLLYKLKSVVHKAAHKATVSTLCDVVSCSVLIVMCCGVQDCGHGLEPCSEPARAPGVLAAQPRSRPYK